MPRRKRFQRLAKEGSWILVGQAMVVLGSLAGVRLLTELMPAAAYGELALGMTIATLVNQLVLGPLSVGITRFYAPAAQANELSAYLGAARKLVQNATAVIVLAMLLTAAIAAVAGQPKWAAISAIALLYAALSGYSVILSGIQTAARQRAVVAIHQGADPLLRALLAAGLVLVFGSNSVAALSGYVVGAALLLVSQAALFRREFVHDAPHTGPGRNWQQQIWELSWPVVTFGIFAWVRLASDRWALQALASTQDVGHYSVLFQLGYYPISLVAGIGMQFFTPILYQRAGDPSDVGRSAEVNRICLRLTAVGIVLTAAAFVVALGLHAQIFRIFVAKEYASVSYLLPWMAVAGGLFAASQFLAANIMAKLKTRDILAPTIICSLAGIGLNILGAYRFGISGVVAACVVFSLLYLLWLFALVRGYKN